MRTTFVAALTAAVVSAVISVSVSNALQPISQTNTAPTLAQIQNLLQNATAADVGALTTQVKALNTTVNGLVPIIHSTAERVYAICFNLGDSSGFPPASSQNHIDPSSDFLDPCYAGFYQFPTFRPDDLYTAPAPVPKG